VGGAGDGCSIATVPLSNSRRAAVPHRPRPPPRRHPSHACGPVEVVLWVLTVHSSTAVPP